MFLKIVICYWPCRVIFDSQTLKLHVQVYMYTYTSMHMCISKTVNVRNWVPCTKIIQIWLQAARNHLEFKKKYWKAPKVIHEHRPRTKPRVLQGRAQKSKQRWTKLFNIKKIRIFRQKEQNTLKYIYSYHL